MSLIWSTPYKIITDKDESVALIIANEDGTPFLGENQGL